MAPDAGSRLLQVLHADRDLVVVNKPARVPAGAGRGPEPTVAGLLADRAELAGGEQVLFVSRLDRDASGVLVCARTRNARRKLIGQFSYGRAEKVYLAIVAGFVAADGKVEQNLVFDRRENRVRPAVGRGSPAVTTYRIRQRLAGNTLLECRPVPDRAHQVRAHLAAIGHPLAVDPVYGGSPALLLSRYKPDYRPSARRPERPLIERLTLHAWRMTFEHPTGGQSMAFEADMPKDFRATVAQLGRLV